MDVVLEVFDTFIFDRLYAGLLPATSIDFTTNIVKDAATTTFSSMHELPTPYHAASQFLQLKPSQYASMSHLPRHNIWRQTISLYLITWLFGLFISLGCATLSYIFVFDKATFTHPKYLKNQIRQEIRQTMISIPFMAILTTPFFLTEVRGYGKLYDAPSEAPFPLYNYLQFPFFILFTDFFIYWIHRGLHHPLIYKRLHKPHHRWIMPTPYASHAFHPVDGFTQSLPYHIFPFLFPLQKLAYVALFIFINIWTIVIHDGEYVANSSIINGAACHTMHHLYFNYNYGQFTTLWDRVGGSYRKPNAELFSRESKMSKAEWERQCQETEKVQEQVEGADDRDYGKHASSCTPEPQKKDQ
ncbi:MAG: c-5 sterol desaturase [Icmadophila ericetorum]|nr:c-5 sterol desaturase [Icmadophila ericetorum]